MNDLIRAEKLATVIWLETPRDTPKEAAAYSAMMDARRARKVYKTDPNAESVRELIKQRAAVGLAKYGVTTERTDVDLIGWLAHLQEELADACVYIEAAKRRLKE